MDCPRYPSLVCILQDDNGPFQTIVDPPPPMRMLSRKNFAAQPAVRGMGEDAKMVETDGLAFALSTEI